MSDFYFNTDPYLAPYKDKVLALLEHTRLKEGLISRYLAPCVYDFADYHLTFGLHRTKDGWLFREWAPSAASVFIIGEKTAWEKDSKYRLERVTDTGVFEKRFDRQAFRHGDLYRLKVEWNGGEGDRIPTAAGYVVQDPSTLIFNARVWDPEPFSWQATGMDSRPDPLLIYEAHAGMAQEDGRIGTWAEFEQHMLPKIKKAGYNAVQLMAVQEHPYYGSFGYHVSSFFAPSSRFGTPEELKSLIDKAHSMGLRVFMDMIHSHAVSNEVEGLSRFDGTLHQFFHSDEKGHHSLWDSRCFNYGKLMVVRFLLSNLRYWLEEYNVDGFRFDGITSMLFEDHGIGKAFTGYDDYYNSGLDVDGLAYLFLANRLVHGISPSAVTIAEDVSGFPGLAAPSEQGGIGFDYRFSMGVPDFWIKLLKEYADEDWPLGNLWHELISSREEEKTISYVESHDQALVGDQTVMMRLMGPDIYDSMSVYSTGLKTFRAVSLHKMIRLVTLATSKSGYLNFMGNEFGHPEWIDFPSEQNNWSYHYARRQWSLRYNQVLYYSKLADFDAAMIELVKSDKIIDSKRPELLHLQEDNRVISFMRGAYVFAFNFHPNESFRDYIIQAPTGTYKTVLNTDESRFGGNGRLVDDQIHHTLKGAGLSLYLPTRTGIVLKKM